MPFIPVPEELQLTYDARASAREMVDANNETSRQMLLAFIAGYQRFWRFGVISMSEAQQALDVLGPQNYLPILQNAAKRIADIKDDFGESWDAGWYERYLSAPYTYTIDQQTMQITLTGIADAWTEEPEVLDVEIPE